LVENALLHFDAQRYRLHAWAIMPNHVHVLVTPLDETLSDIVQAWKSFTAHGANALLDRHGVFWAPEYYDRAVRDDAHFANAVEYIAMNPVKARLCAFLAWARGDTWVRAGGTPALPGLEHVPGRLNRGIPQGG
jgi:hypothetical protein